LWSDLTGHLCCRCLSAERSNKDDKSLLFSASSFYSTVSDSFVNSVEPSQNFYDSSSTEQCLHLSATDKGVSGCKRALFTSGVQVTAMSDDSHANRESSPVGVSDDLVVNCDVTLLNREHSKVPDTENDWVIGRQSASVHHSAESVSDMLSVLSDSGVDSSTVSSQLCINELSADSVATPIAPRRPFHSRSASDGGIFKPSQHYPNLSQHPYLRRNYEQGKL